MAYRSADSQRVRHLLLLFNGERRHIPSTSMSVESAAKSAFIYRRKGQTRMTVEVVEQFQGGNVGHTVLVTKTIDGTFTEIL